MIVASCSSLSLRGFGGGRGLGAVSYRQSLALSLSDEEDAAASINCEYTHSNNFCQANNAIASSEGVGASRARA
jgi:hypothetical protein